MASSTNNQSRTISLQIPPGADPGDTLTFVVDGAELELTVPEGASVGQVLELQVGCGVQEEETIEREKVTRIALHDNKLLELHHHLPAANNNNNNQDDDDDDKTADGTHAMAWPAGRELQKCLCSNDLLPSDTLQNIRECESVLELGSGVGIVGLALAATTVNNNNKKKKEVVLSDVASAMPLLEYNVKRNQHLIPTSVTVQTQVLQWELESSVGDHHKKYDLIVGSDLLYNAAMIAPLVSTLKRHANKHILLAVRWRKPSLERKFFQDTSDYIDWKLVAPQDGLSWKTYGDPTNDASNQFFLQTMVAVQKTLKPLADITEDDTTCMSREEHDAWERLQIQVYQGTVIKGDVTNEDEREAKRARVQ